MTAAGRQTLSVSSSGTTQQQLKQYSAAHSGCAARRIRHNVIDQALLTQVMEDQHAG